MRLAASLVLVAGVGACATAGNTWVNQPLDGSERSLDDERLLDTRAELPPGARLSSGERAAAPVSRTIGATPTRETNDSTASSPASTRALERTATTARPEVGGKKVGTFRNTYYDFPSELDFEGANVDVKSQACETLASVKRGFFEAVCVQGSGTLRQGATVSFARRDCDCAEICPRTGQKICFDLLDPKQFPWGRGATGKAITPLLTVAVDSEVIPLGTGIYVPEYDGLPRDPEERTLHDGCFVAQDRGLKVKGQHLDIFTGHRSMTALWNRLVPSNRGVTVVLDTQRCARATQ
jgi:3D (Asp-Asp-Asp) domain-containing protein